MKWPELIVNQCDTGDGVSLGGHASPVVVYNMEANR